MAPIVQKEFASMKRSTLAASVSACVCLGFALPLLAAEPVPNAVSTAANAPAQACLTDLRAFHDQIQKDGYWLGESSYGYGYPMLGYGYGDLNGGVPTSVTAAHSPPPPIAAPTIPPMAAATSGAAAPIPPTGYWRGRSGYEVRTLLASANILARLGQQVPCESVLAATRDLYKQYLVEVRQDGMPRAGGANWRKAQIASAEPVTKPGLSFRSDQLVGTDVRNLQDESLGSIDDLIMSPQTGKILYLVVERGGIFGIDEKYVPVPWTDFKVTANMHMLVLDVSKDAMTAAPRVGHDQFSKAGNFAAMSQSVDSYWVAHQPKAK
jgi:sporulation protein YlmC with PRC-barrel domain